MKNLLLNSIFFILFFLAVAYKASAAYDATQYMSTTLITTNMSAKTDKTTAITLNINGTYTTKTLAQNDTFIVSTGTRLTQTATIDFANTLAGASTDQTVTVTGAQLNDPVVIGAPNGAVVGNGGYYGWVSATNTVTVRFFNNNLLAALNPASGTFTIVVLQ